MIGFCLPDSCGNLFLCSFEIMEKLSKNGVVYYHNIKLQEKIATLQKRTKRFKISSIYKKGDGKQLK